MSQQFYIAVNGQQTGPFSIDDLKAKNIQRDTLVWTEGLDNWTKAEHIPLLKEVLRATPPPLPNTETKTSSQQVPPPCPPTPTELREVGFEQDKDNPNLFTRHDGLFQFYGNVGLDTDSNTNQDDFAEKVLKEIDELRKSKQ